MAAPPSRIIADSLEVLPMLRDLFSQHPGLQDRDPHELAAMLGTREAAVQAALEALSVEGEVLA